MKVTNRIEEIVEPLLNNLGFELVQVTLLGKPNPSLQVMAEPIETRPMSLDDCGSISHALSALLDIEDLISSAYTLEVSSPGLDRPLIQLAHFERFKGHEARIETSTAIDGSKHFSGRLGGVKGNNILMNVKGDERIFPFRDIEKAKLIINDEIFAKTEGLN